MPQPNVNDVLSALMLMVAIVGLLLILIVPKTEYYARTRTLGIAFFAAGLGSLAYLFLIENPDVLRDVREHVALTLIGMVLVTLSVMRYLRKRP